MHPRIRHLAQPALDRQVRRLAVDNQPFLRVGWPVARKSFAADSE
jgi:hypothetical protein